MQQFTRHDAIIGEYQIYGERSLEEPDTWLIKLWKEPLDPEKSFTVSARTFSPDLSTNERFMIQSAISKWNEELLAEAKEE